MKFAPSGIPSTTTEIPASVRSTLLLPCHQAVAGQETVDRAIDGEQRIDAAGHLDRQRRLQIGQLEEVAPAMAPARRLGDWARFAFAVVELAEPSISIGLKNASVTGEMPGRMLADAIARESRRIWPAIARLSGSVSEIWLSPGFSISASIVRSRSRLPRIASIFSDRFYTRENTAHFAFHGIASSSRRR